MLCLGFDEDPACAGSTLNPSPWQALKPLSYLIRWERKHAGLIDAVNKSTNVRYEYNPYGELIRATGLLARQNPFRWSTKFWDEESGLVYYGYRYYSPQLGRWINRVPQEEQGGLNLYAFVGNDAINSIDPTGEAGEPTYGLPRDFWRWIHDRIRRDYGRPLTKEEAMAEYENWLAMGMPKGPRRRTGFKFGGGGNGRSGMLIGAGLFLTVLVSEAQAALADSSGVDCYFTYDAADNLVRNLTDFYRHTMTGDTACADMDAIMIAIDVLSISGNELAAMWVWEVITD